MRILLDTNVLLNWLIESNSKHTEAASLVLSCLIDGTEGFVTSHSLTDIFYVLRKYHQEPEARRKFILIMVHNFTILTEDKTLFLEALGDSDFFDLEDGLQMKCAENANLDYIVTEKLKDFTNSAVPAISIAEALARL
ncbi:MAG: PIN domain-containing protein [Treponema sp.]|nr:PIN domain-containing protein [Treponema sp.]